MGLSEQASTMLARLNAFTAKQASCKKVFCSTCGGKFATLSKSLTPELRTELREWTDLLSIQDLAGLGDWALALKEVVPAAIKAVYKKAARAINPEDLEQLDQYLLLARKSYGEPDELGDLYQRLLDGAVSLAVSSGNSSLIETLILVLGKDALQHEDLLSLAMARKNETNISRVLYNKLREEVPDVREFSGHR